MKVSIITVAYNAADTIERTICSVIDQGYPCAEHIIIDGGSLDGTMTIVNRYRNKFASVVSEADTGIYDAMNKGLLCASGDVIAFLNADDEYVHRHVLGDVAEMYRGRQLDAVFGDVVFVSPNAPDKVVRRYRSRSFSPQKIAWGWMPAHPGMFVHRRVFERFGPFKTNYRIAGDFEFVARAFGSNTLKYANIDSVLVRMRIGGVSTDGLRSTIQLNREVLRACRENGISSNLFKIMTKYPSKVMELIRR
jgi:glycosyltransferase involved in cell wall biosynthesis